MFMFWYRYIFGLNQFHQIDSNISKQQFSRRNKWQYHFGNETRKPPNCGPGSWRCGHGGFCHLSQVPATKPPLLDMMKESGRLRHHRAAALHEDQGMHDPCINFWSVTWCPCTVFDGQIMWNPILWWKNIFDIVWITVFPGFYNVVNWLITRG